MVTFFILVLVVGSVATAAQPSFPFCRCSTYNCQDSPYTLTPSLYRSASCFTVTQGPAGEMPVPPQAAITFKVNPSCNTSFLGATIQGNNWRNTKWVDWASAGSEVKLHGLKSSILGLEICLRTTEPCSEPTVLLGSTVRYAYISELPTEKRCPVCRAGLSLSPSFLRPPVSLSVTPLAPQTPLVPSPPGAPLAPPPPSPMAPQQPPRESPPLSTGFPYHGSCLSTLRWAPYTIGDIYVTSYSLDGASATMCAMYTRNVSDASRWCGAYNLNKIEMLVGPDCRYAIRNVSYVGFELFFTVAPTFGMYQDGDNLNYVLKWNRFGLTDPEMGLFCFSLTNFNNCIDDTSRLFLGSSARVAVFDPTNKCCPVYTVDAP